MSRVTNRQAPAVAVARDATPFVERRAHETYVVTRAPFSRDTLKMWTGRGVIYLVLSVGALGMIFPVFWMFMTSSKKEFYSSGSHMIWFPKPWAQVAREIPDDSGGVKVVEETRFGWTHFTKVFTTDHYKELISRAGAKSSGAADDFIVATMNTFIYTVVATLGSLLLCSMAGYALAKKKFRGSKFVLMSILTTMMIPGIMVLLPNFIITMRYLKGYNNFVGLIVPGLASSFGVFLMRQYMLSVPNELLDAAKVDGAGETRTFFQIVLPLVTPILVAFGILQVLGFWNNLLWPLVITKDLTVLQVALLNLIEIGSQRMGPAMAGAAISSTPIIILFLLVRKQFVQAMTSGALKG